MNKAISIAWLLLIQWPRGCTCTPSWFFWLVWRW